MHQALGRKRKRKQGEDVAMLGEAKGKLSGEGGWRRRRWRFLYTFRIRQCSITINAVLSRQSQVALHPGQLRPSWMLEQPHGAASTKSLD
ncbi:hypothetical protein NUW54_g13521 [Trametes sanguinea]|uniref:Uncharacterized protein n=1 Tax=Trametes sanguinea TaxID=158606 RepID=A0ACC1ML40_9APHY|nr:hypothetical protein NUW54_g13521 [Trametes sanguinea]